MGPGWVDVLLHQHTVLDGRSHVLYRSLLIWSLFAWEHWTLLSFWWSWNQQLKVQRFYRILKKLNWLNKFPPEHILCKHHIEGTLGMGAVRACSEHICIVLYQISVIPTLIIFNCTRDFICNPRKACRRWFSKYVCDYVLTEFWYK